MVQACGENSGDPASGADATPIVSNRLPELSVPSAVEFLSGDVAIITTAAASDADGDTIRLSLSGADASLFAIESNGDIRFLQAPRFIKPRDAARIINTSSLLWPQTLRVQPMRR